MNFYKEQRIDLGILIDNGNPEGGKWSYDDMNRMRFPKDKEPPKISYSEENIIYKEAKAYVDKEFNGNVGEIYDQIVYPYDFESAKKWFKDFLKNRFHDFGPYEDAVVKDERVLNHSLLSPLINSGLLSPKFIINESIKFYKKHNIPLNSCEGFIRQIIGWREFIRGVYEVKGSYERTHNFWNFSRKIPKSFYNGTTGIEPVDDSIKKVIKSAYSHHIERLMVIGNFMLLCEFDPDEVYRWFMELYIDAYDWVMVPNVYGMSQFADGGLMSTKPYISGSSYILKMSDYKKGKWCEVWDGLFWNFMNKQREFFVKNPRMRMLISSFDKMDESKRNIHLENAKSFLKNLDK
jgi:deoxyribodipyrimidine photolyase-related protein